LDFEWLSDAKLVLTDELVAASQKGRSNIVESDFDDIETEEE
jgi:ribosome maturation factor RimP